MSQGGGGPGGRVVKGSSRTFDLLFEMIIDLKRSIDLKWLLMSGAIFIRDDFIIFKRGTV